MIALVGLLATAAHAKCLGGSEVTFSPGVTGCVVDSGIAVQIRRFGPPQAFALAEDGAPVLESVAAVDLDGDPSLESPPTRRAAAPSARGSSTPIPTPRGIQRPTSCRPARSG